MAQSFARFCSRCGNEITRVQKFCSKCGANVAKMSPPPSVSPQRSSTEEAPSTPSSRPPLESLAGVPEQSAFESSEASSPDEEMEGSASRPSHHRNDELLERASRSPQRSSEEQEQFQTACASAVPQSSETMNPLSRPELDEPDDLQAEEKVAVNARDWSGEQSGRLAAEATIVQSGESEHNVLLVEGAREQPMTPLPDALVSVVDDQAESSASRPDGAEESDIVEQVPTQMLSQTPLPSSLSEALPVQLLPTQLLDEAGVQQEQIVAQASSSAQGQPLLLPSTPQPLCVDVSVLQLQPRSLVSWRSGRKGTLSWQRVIGLSLLLMIVLGVGIFAVVWLLLGLNAPGQPSITTINLGTTVKYAGVDVTIVNAQRAQTFIDDPQAVSDGMLRLKLMAQNKTNVSVNLQYATIAHIILPTGKVLAPLHLVTSNGQLNPNATLTDLIDFAFPQNIHIDQVKLVLGSADEAQLVVTLDGRANVGQYASKTVALKQEAIPFYGLDWTLTSVTTQWYIDGQHAKKGMRYLMLTMKVDNPLKQTAIVGSTYTYVQLQVNNTSVNLVNSTLPVAFDGGVIGKEGTATFLVPQEATSFTLILSKPADGFDGTDSSITFQIS